VTSTASTNQSPAPSSSSSAIPRTPTGGRGWLRRHHRALIAALIIALIEVVIFNLGFWMSQNLPKSIAVDASKISVGTGLEKSGLSGVLTVTDGAHSYVEVSDINAPVGSVRLTPTDAQPATTSANGTASRYDASAPDFEWWATARLDVLPQGSTHWVRGNDHQYSAASPSSTYIANASTPATTKIAKVRVWFLQSEQSSFAYAGLGINEYPHFSINPVRVLLMAVIAAFVIGFRPSSRLYRTRLDTHSAPQRWILVGAMVPFAAIIIGVVIAQLGYTPLTDWNEAGDYTYDFDQYAHLADSMFKGLPWLDLPVPDALSAAPNPYSTQVRAQLLAQGATPIFWDHAFYDGHWYCYFGALPAVLFYLPYQAITSLRIPGGAMLPTPDVVALLLGLFALVGALLVVRFITRHFPNTSLGMTILSVLGFLCGGNLFFLAFRMNFYAVPMLSSLVLTCLGLYLWMGARRVTDDSVGGARAHIGGVKSRSFAGITAAAHNSTHMWTVADGSPRELWAHGTGAVGLSKVRLSKVRLSKVRLELGFVCMAATLGCRPTFVLAALLAFPLFWAEISAGQFFSYVRPLAWKNHAAARKNRKVGTGSGAGAMAAGSLLGERTRLLRPLTSLGNDAAALLPALMMCLPIVAYNFWRFGSFLNFGNDYQLTVTDLTTYREPVKLIAPITYYYLFQPLSVTAEFPLLKLTSTPLESWQLTEPHAGGFFWLVPFALLGLVALLMHRCLASRHLWGLTCTMLGMAAFLCVFDAYKAGLSWRYMADFGWLVALAAVAAACGLEEWGRTGARARGAAYALSRTTAHTAAHTATVAISFVRILVAILVGLSLIITVLTCFMPGRIDNLMVNASQVYFEVKAWFTGWLSFV
jgi:hypothetical protein